MLQIIGIKIKSGVNHGSISRAPIIATATTRGINKIPKEIFQYDVRHRLLHKLHRGLKIGPSKNFLDALIPFPSQ